LAHYDILTMNICRNRTFRYEPFWSGPFRSGDISVTTFLHINNWLHVFI